MKTDNRIGVDQIASMLLISLISILLVFFGMDLAAAYEDPVPTHSPYDSIDTSIFDLNDGLVAYYSFDDGTATDESGNENHGTLYGTPEVAEGIQDQAFKFGGYYDPDYIVVPNSDTLSFNDNFTFVGWFNIQDNTSMDAYGRVSQYGIQTLIGKTGDRNGLFLFVIRSSNDGLWHLRAQNGGCGYWGGCGPGSVGFSSQSGFQIKGWHMFSFTHGNGAAKLYLDGVLEGEMASEDFSLNPAMSNNPIYMGEELAGSGINAMWFPLNGLLDEIRIYNRVLSESEIQLLYQQMRHSISGQVTDANGDPLPGVTITDDAGHTTTTDSDGRYTLSGLAEGTYTITPAKEGFAFSPTSRTVSVPPDATGVDFVGRSTVNPLVFIPGITGSYLRERGGAQDLWPGQMGTDRSALSNRPDQRHDIIAPDVIRKAVLNQLPDQNIYASLLERLTSNYIEYQVAGDPARRTSEGCDLSQKDAKPTLFVFAYDWRLSNDYNADLLKEYVACIHRFYPGAKIDILAHSMGGVIARRYILKTAPEHFVRKVITVGTPWLGAPKFLNVLENGELGLGNILVSSGEVAWLLEAFPGAHELMPSATYFEYADRSSEPDVFAEYGFDINEDGNAFQTYDYDALVNYVNARYPREDDCGEPKDPVCRVGDNNRSFHSVKGQDKWTDGPQDVHYFYIVGIRGSRSTIGGFVATPYPVCREDIADLQVKCRSYPVLEVFYTDGDGTVPLISARRAPSGQDPDGTNVFLQYITPSNAQNDSSADHLGMLHNTEVLKTIEQILNGSSAALQSASVEETIPPPEPAYYLKVVGTNVAYVTNSQGQITGVISPTLILREALEVSFTPFSTENFQAVIPTNDTYTVTFESGEFPMFIELVREGAEPPDYAARWRDLVIPPRTTMQLVLSPEGIRELSYDASGDRVPETPVEQEPIVVQGPAAADVTPPTVTITVGADQVVTITAEDESGMAAIYYSYDGQTFHTYTGPITPPVTTTTVYAFAEDTLANRSELISASLGRSLILLPLVTRSGE